jgi:hypothetical protein
MKNTTLIATFAVIAAAGCASSTHPVARPQQAGLACNQLDADSQQVLASVLAPGATFNAEPIKEVRVRVRASQEAEVVGAQVHLPAPQNVSKEYLERVLVCHTNTSVAAHGADPFHPSVGHVNRVNVRSLGGTLAIQIRGNNRAANNDILQRSQQLTTPTDVTVEQVGTVDSPVRF